MLEGAINRVLEWDEDAPELLKRLNGRLLQLEFEGIGIRLFFGFGPYRINVSAESDDEPDTIVSGSPQALFTMAMPDDLEGWGSADSRVNISGDATLARDLERLFSQLDPDWEGAMSRLFGEVLGHQVAMGLRGGMKQARAAASNASKAFEDYAQRSDGPTPSSEEFREFSRAVEQTHGAVNRLERKLAALEDRIRPAES